MPKVICAYPECKYKCGSKYSEKQNYCPKLCAFSGYEGMTDDCAHQVSWMEDDDGK